MSTPIVLQLQELASDESSSVAGLLRKALLVATKLDLGRAQEWIRHELNGYADPKQIPTYRQIVGRLCAHNPYHGMIPFIINNAELMEALQKIHVHESVESLLQLASSSRKGEITFAFGPEQEAALMRMQDGFVQLKPYRVVGANTILAIVEAVRTRVLEWALALEKEGIMGEGLSFSDREKKIAEGSQNVSIQNFQGVLGNVSGGNISQSMSMMVTPGEFASLANYLKAQGVDETNISALESAVRDDPEPKGPGKFGPRVSGWIGRMVGKAADGSWGVAIGAAANVLGTAITKFYGL